MDSLVRTTEGPESVSGPPETLESNDQPHSTTTTTTAEAAAALADEAVENQVQPADTVVAMDEATALKGLTEDVRDQGELERDITNQANLVMIEQEDERDEKRICKANGNIEKLEGEKRRKMQRLQSLANNPLMRKRCLEEVAQLNADIAALKKDISDIQSRINERHIHDGA
ncbi:hypothetical protein DL95DRAFT_382361, partial [Leptodontidium sp. 2 PMI_412]